MSKYKQIAVVTLDSLEERLARVGITPGSPLRAGSPKNRGVGRVTPLKVRSQSTSYDRHPNEPIVNEVPQKPPVLRRNRGVQTVLKQPDFPHRAVVETNAKWVGLIREKSTPASGKGLGGATLIAADLALTLKHCLPDGDFTVTFTDYSSENKVFYRYPATKLSNMASLNGVDLGIDLGEKSEFVLIRIQKKPEDFPVGFVEMAQSHERSTAFIHIGYKTGQKEKVSIAQYRDVPLARALERNIPLMNQPVVWSHRKTAGVIRLIWRDGNDTFLSIESKGCLHRFKYCNGSVVKEYRNGVTKPATLYIQRPIAFGVDHVIVGHQSGFGSSGGAYFLPDGRLFAIHQAKIDSQLMADGAEDHFENHFALLPQARQITTFFEPYLDLERFQSLSKIKYSQIAKGQAIQLENQTFIIQAVTQNEEADFIIESHDTGGRNRTFCLTGAGAPQLTLDDTPVNMAQVQIDVNYRVLENPAPIETVMLDQLEQSKHLRSIAIDLRERIQKNKNIKRTFCFPKTDATLEANCVHTTIRSAQQRGLSVHFVIRDIDRKPAIDVHMIGTHHNNIAYQVRDCSDAFRNRAQALGQWSVQQTTKMNLFSF